MSLMGLVTSVFVGLVFIGLFLGFFRGWKKALIRTCVLIGCVVLSIIFAPMISRFFMSKITDGTKIVIFSQTIDMEETLNGMIKGAELGELFADGSVTNELILAAANILINLVVFFALFIILEIFSLIVYWIVCIVLKIKGREDKEEAEADGEKSQAALEVERDGKYWGLKALASALGVIGSIVITFALMIPVFGVMDVCSGLVRDEQKQEETASAATINNYLSAGLYYTEGDKIGKIESYIEKYANLKRSYDKSFFGKVMKYTGVGKLGTKAFSRLTTVKQGSLKVDLADEFVAITQTYNAYKDIFVKDKLDLSDNKDIEDLNNLYDEAVESEIIKEYIVELVPQMVEKWTNDEKFLGIENPVSGDWEEVVNASIVVFKVESINRITNNFKAYTKLITVANAYGVIDDIDDKKKIEDILLENDTFIKAEVLVLTSTVELRENASVILNEAFEVLYKDIVGEEKEFASNALTLSEIAELNKNNGWVKEAENIQSAVNEMLKVYEVVKVDSSSQALSDELENVGVSIDYARKSKLISKPFRTFIYGFVDKKIDIDDTDCAKAELLENIETKWEDETFSYQKTYRTIQEATNVAKDIVSGDGDVSLDALAPAIKDIINDGGSKEVVAGIIEKDLISEMVGKDDKATADVLSDILETFVTSEKVTNETIDNDIKAGDTVVKVVDNVKNNNGDLKLGETETERNASADQIVSDLVSSEGMMETLTESANSPDGSAISDYTTQVNTEDKATLEAAISRADTTAANKETLKKLFGIA
ncbi:MAG: hypothetical protein IKB06_02505 [Clostridia bacterium]|nr:hypothetical protein [Clostridia bacterium]